MGTPEAPGTGVFRFFRSGNRQRRERRQTPRTHRRIGRGNPTLFARYQQAKDDADRTLGYARNSGQYPLTGRGDVNTYMLFAELARKIVAPHGRVGLLTPFGVATDDTTKEFFSALMESKTLIGLFDFENRLRIFPDVDGRFKFCVLLFGGAETNTAQADFVFFAHNMADLKDKNRHVALSGRDLALLNPNTRTCPIFRSRTDAELTKAIYRRVPVLLDESREEGGNPWGVKFVRMFDQTNDAELFQSPGAAPGDGMPSGRQPMGRQGSHVPAALRSEDDPGLRPPCRQRGHRRRQLGAPGADRSHNSGPAPEPRIRGPAALVGGGC